MLIEVRMKKSCTMLIKMLFYIDTDEDY